MHGQKSIAALAGRTFVWFAITAVLAVGVGLAVGWMLKPGLGVGVLQVASDYTPKDVPGVLDMLFNLVPSNPFQALAGAASAKTADGMTVLVPRNGTVLQVIFFAGLVGFALVKLGEKAARPAQAGRRGQRDHDPGHPLRAGVHPDRHLRPDRGAGRRLWLRTAEAVAAVRGRAVRGLRVPHHRGLRRAAAGAWTQPAEVLPRRRAGHAGRVRGIVAASPRCRCRCAAPPTTWAWTRTTPRSRCRWARRIKMDGCGAIYPALAAVFIAQYTGIELSLSQYVIIALASVLGSFGTAGVPGTAVIMATVVLSAAGLPLEVIGYLYAIDRVLDMMRTMTNVTGQMLVPVLVAKETGMLDRGIYEAASTNVGMDDAGPPDQRSTRRLASRGGQPRARQRGRDRQQQARRRHPHRVLRHRDRSSPTTPAMTISAGTSAAIRGRLRPAINGGDQSAVEGADHPRHDHEQQRAERHAWPMICAMSSVTIGFRPGGGG